MTAFRNLTQHRYFLISLAILFAAIIATQSFFAGNKTFIPNGIEYTHYNNFVIFKQSFFHLLENKDLYILYPAEQWDLYKYSPTFALFMAPLAVLPDFLGLLIWDILNIVVLVLALKRLPISNTPTQWWILGFILLELVTSTQNSQCNALIAGLIIFSFLLLEKKKLALASLCVVACVFIKIFGLVAFALFLFYPNKTRAFLYTLAWTILFLLLPLLVVTPGELEAQYYSWLNMLQNDQNQSIGISVAGIIQTWFGPELKTPVLVSGAILLCLPMVNLRYYKELRFKLLFLASTLIWIIIFNHKAESATFVIAMTGVAIWYFSQARNPINLALLIFAFVLTSLSPTDIFPKSIRENLVVPYALKALPCVLIWLKIIWELLVYKPEKTNSKLHPSV